VQHGLGLTIGGLAKLAGLAALRANTIAPVFLRFRYKRNERNICNTVVFVGFFLGSIRNIIRNIASVIRSIFTIERTRIFAACFACFGCCACPC
jgi:hypothetical protein